MEEINEYIKSNKLLLEERKKQFEEATSDDEKAIIKDLITATDYYIRGLQDAKKYIEKERGKER